MNYVPAAPERNTRSATALLPKYGLTRTVVLRALFAADGIVKHSLVLSGLPHELTQRAIKAARRIKFSPATIDADRCRCLFSSNTISIFIDECLFTSLRSRL